MIMKYKIKIYKNNKELKMNIKKQMILFKSKLKI